MQDGRRILEGVEALLERHDLQPAGEYVYGGYVIYNV